VFSPGSSLNNIRYLINLAHIQMCSHLALAFIISDISLCARVMRYLILFKLEPGENTSVSVLE
jgi:hypothetical protein